MPISRLGSLFHSGAIQLTSMLKLVTEIVASTLFVAVSTFVIFNQIGNVSVFWDAQFLWSVALAIGWVVVSFGYFHQGWLVREGKSASHVSIVLPSAVFIVQCILFVKGIYYDDWSLVAGAIMVNSGVIFSIYHILLYSNRKKRLK